MHKLKRGAVAALAIAAASCGGGGSDNVMSPQANALSPAEVDAALGPETGNTADLNMAGNDITQVGNSTDNAIQPDEPDANDTSG